jgi:hypothetical protein
MAQYKSRSIIEVNGTVVSSNQLMEFSVGARTVAKSVRLMNAVGSTQLLSEVTLSITEAILADGVQPVDLENIIDGTITEEPIGGGRRRTFVNATTTEIGEENINGADEATRVIEFTAEEIVNA